MREAQNEAYGLPVRQDFRLCPFRIHSFPVGGDLQPRAEQSLYGSFTFRKKQRITQTFHRCDTEVMREIEIVKDERRRDTGRGHLKIKKTKRDGMRHGRLDERQRQQARA